MLLLAIGLVLLGGGLAHGATVSYPLEAYYLPSSQSANLQAALDQYHEVRLDPRPYNSNAAKPITLQSGYRLYGLTTQIPPVTIAPGATGVVLCDVSCGSLTFPASNLVTSNNLIMRLLNTTIYATEATLESNLFLDIFQCQLLVDNATGGHFLNNRIIRFVNHGDSYAVSLVGDNATTS